MSKFNPTQQLVKPKADNAQIKFKQIVMVMMKDGKLGYVPLVLSLTSSKMPFLVFAEEKDGKKILVSSRK